MSTKRTRPTTSAVEKPEKSTKTSEGSKSMELSSTSHDEFETSQELFKMLLEMKVQELKPEEGKIFVCQRTDKIVDVWKGLIRHNFLSVPVIQTTKQKYFGFVDVADIVHFFVENFGSSQMRGVDDFWKLIEKEEHFISRQVRDIMKYPLSRRNPFHPIPVDYSLFSAVEALAREPSLHRVPIVDENRTLVGLISQSRLITFFKEHMQTLGNKKNKPLSLIKSLFHEVYSVKHEDTSLDAFKLMITKNVSGVAVVDKMGKLVGGLSLRDLKAIHTDGSMFWRLHEPVYTFLEKMKKDFKGVSDPMVHVKPEDTIERVINLLAENKVHRVYIVDVDMKPIGCCSIKDLLLDIITIH